jgi:hypothetical protein
MQKSLLLSADLWRALSVDALYSLHEDGGIRSMNEKHAPSVYHPADEIPSYVFCRTSGSTKRLEKELTLEEESVTGHLAIYTVKGGGNPIGVLVELMTDQFKAAHCTPDGVHLVNAASELDSDLIVKPVFSYKTFRSFLLGPNDDSPQDVILTAKTRWFRKRVDPKALGFSKDKS